MRAMRFRAPSLTGSACGFLGFLVAMALSAAWGGIEHPLVAAVVILVWALVLAVAIIRGPYRRHLDRRHAEDRADGRWADELAGINAERVRVDRRRSVEVLTEAYGWQEIGWAWDFEPAPGDPADDVTFSTRTGRVEPTAEQRQRDYAEAQRILREGDLLDALLKPSTAPPGSVVTYQIEGESPFADDARRNGPSAYAEGKADQGAHAALADLDSAMVTLGDVTPCECAVCVGESRRMAEMVRTYPVPPEYLPES